MKQHKHWISGALALLLALALLSAAAFAATANEMYQNGSKALEEQ